MPGRRRLFARGRGVLLVLALAIVSTALSVRLIVAQDGAAHDADTAAMLVRDAASIVRALEVERDAVSGLPADVKRAIDDLRAVIAAQAQAVRDGDFAAARDQHALLLRMANRIGRALQRHYAPDAEDANTRPRLEGLCARLVARADQLRDAAGSNRLAVDLTAVDAAAQTARKALERGSDAQLKRALQALRAAIEQLETAVATAPVVTP